MAVSQPEKETREAAESSPQPSAGNKPSTVVGLGASTGGLRALQGFFAALPPDSGLVFVVVTHMAPDRESLLPELLQQQTEMPVRQVKHYLKVEANHVYVIPPGKRILMTDTHVDTREFEQPRGHRTPIDDFFRSLASVHHHSVAVILSGDGTDGSVGVKAVKEHGGLLLVQHPDEAEADGMPRAAIATGLADLVLPAAELARKLVEYHSNGVHLPHLPEQLTQHELSLLQSILTQVHNETGHDFRQYKRSTVLRRVTRRMQINGHQTLDAYLGYLRHTPAESHALFNDLLIGVTTFFRDHQHWQALAEQVIPRLFNGKGPDGSIRVWSIGCSTGEEAYSLAILLLEEAERRKQVPEIQIFASDLAKQALIGAREGLYPDAIEADVSQERLERFFTRQDSHYRVRRELRDMVLFTQHSVLRDPPFSRLDLISSRNLLIYLQPALQEKAFAVFHYALRPGGYLFLGSTETAGMGIEFFQPVDKHHHIYQAQSWSGEGPQLPPLPLTARFPGRTMPELPQPGQQSWTPSKTVTPKTSHHRALEAHSPPSLLVNADYQIVHLSETAGRYLQHPQGPVTRDLLRLVQPELKQDLHLALSLAFEKNKASFTPPNLLQIQGAPCQVIAAVRPHQEGEEPDGLEKLALILFLEDESQTSTAVETVPHTTAGQELVDQLARENQHLRQRLQSTVEQYTTSNEELKAANEELQSINEEYRSATEELKTSREELQSINEELHTVNNELAHKLEEMAQAKSDLENLMVVTDVATIFLNRELQIQRYTPNIEALFNIRLLDRGRPIAHLTNHLNYTLLPEDAAHVLSTLVPLEQEMQDAQGRWFLVRLRPYRTVEDRIEGVVVTFVEISQLKETEQQLRRAKDLNEQIINTLEERVQERTTKIQELATTLTLAEQEERDRIARVLHDDLQQHLYALQVNLNTFDSLLRRDDRSDLLRLVTAMRETLSDSMQITRNLSVDLSPPVLYHEGLTEAIQWLKAQMEQQYPLQIEVRAEKTFFVHDHGLRVLLFQAVRELLFNIVKHAQAEQATVDLRQEVDRLQIAVHDNGVGFEPAAPAVASSLCASA